MPVPNVTVEHKYSPAVVDQGPNICILDEIRMVQPSEDAYLPGEGWDDLYGEGKPNPYY